MDLDGHALQFAFGSVGSQSADVTAHDVIGRVIVDFEDVLEAVERLVGLHETAYLVPSFLQPQPLEVWERARESNPQLQGRDPLLFIRCCYA